MEKITWNGLHVELTRKCQLACTHCARGNAQKINIKNEDIDNLLKHTEQIMLLNLTGGEPTLNLKSMQFIVDKLIEYCIPLYELNIITNGVDIPRKFIRILKRYKMLIDLSNGCDSIEKVIIGMSMDDFHIGYDKEKQYKKLQKKLKGIAIVQPMLQGQLPVAIGRARNLDIALRKKKVEKTKIEVQTKDIKHCCKNFKENLILNENQVVVICAIYLTAKGNLTAFEALDTHEEKDLAKNIICHVSAESYLSEILKYNKDKISCKEFHEIDDNRVTLDEMIESVRIKEAWKNKGRLKEYQALMYNYFKNRLCGVTKRDILSNFSAAGLMEK